MRSEMLDHLHCQQHVVNLKELGDEARVNRNLRKRDAKDNESFNLSSLVFFHYISFIFSSSALASSMNFAKEKRKKISQKMGDGDLRVRSYPRVPRDT